MATALTRHVICILGHWRNLDGVDAVVQQMGAHDFKLDREFSQVLPDSRMITSFEASYDRVTPSMTENDWQAVKGHTAVAYVLSPPIPKEKAVNISGLTLKLTVELLKSGGVAAKGESAGVAHGRKTWLKLAADLAQARERNDAHEAGAILYRTWVRRPLLDNNSGVYYSCGMHLLGMPDIEIDNSLDLNVALQWMDLLGLYLVSDGPTRPIKDGEGFRLKNEGPRRIIHFRPCERDDPNSFFFNPYGYIRLEPDL